MKTHLFAPVTRTLCRLLAGAVLVLIHFGSSSAHAQRMPQDSWYLAKEMAYGSERPKFRNPNDLSVGPDGNLYICDRYNHQIQVVSQDGIFLRKWGTYGSAPGQLNEPSGIFITPDGKVYVSEAINHRIQVFDSRGNSLLTMGQPGTGEGQLNGPYGVAVDNAGNVYTADRFNNRVMVFAPDGSYLRQWGGAGDTNGQFRDPVGITRTPDNKIAVCETAGYSRTQVFLTNGIFQFQFTTSGRPHGIKTDANGNFYVVSREWNGVWVYDPSGNEIRHFGQNGGGTGAGQFNPHGVVVRDGKVFIGDWDNHRIVVFTTNGAFVQNFGSNGYPLPIATGGGMHDAARNVYLADSENRAIKKYDTNLSLIRSIGSEGSGDGQFGSELSLAIGTNNVIYALDRSNQRVEMFGTNGAFLGKFGTMGSSNGKFSSPYGIAVGKEGRVYVTDKDRNQVQVFDARGNYLFKFGKQGSLDAQFQAPQDIVALPDGRIVVGDRGNGRLQIFDAEGKFLKKSTWNPERLCGSSDGNLYGSWGDGWITSGGIGFLDLSASDLNQPLKTWDAKVNGSLCELPNGDLLHVGYDDVARIWKRTYRVATPDITRGMPLPVIVAQKRRPGTTLVDIDYKVTDSDSPTVTTALVAFRNGDNTLNDVIPMKSFVEGTAAGIGSNITTGEVHRVTWDASKDWSTNFANIQFQIIAKDNRDLLNLDFIEIPGVTNATTTNPPLKISKSPLSDNDFLYAWYWLLGRGDTSIRLNGSAVYKSEGFDSLDSALGSRGLVAEYSDLQNSNNPTVSRVESMPYIPYMYPRSQSTYAPINAKVLQVKWKGYIIPPVTGTYDFGTGQMVNITIGGSGMGFAPWWGRNSLSLEAGKIYPIEITYTDRQDGWDGRQCDIRWTAPGSNQSELIHDVFYTGNSALDLSKSYVPVGTQLAYLTNSTYSGRAFLLSKMGLREATPAEITRAKEAGTPGVVNQWTPKFQVGPGERPAAVNAYGFDTGGTGTWVVPITVTNNATN